VSLTEEFFESLVSDINSQRIELPTLPEVALKIRDTVAKDDVSAKEVSDVISSDAAMSARLLQVVNSPLYRGAQLIDDVNRAVARLGFTTTRDLVTGLAMRQMFQATTEATDTRLRNIWEHSTQVASISQMLAKTFTRLKPDQAMLGGLIHDIGALPILVRAEDSDELMNDLDLLDNMIRELHPRVGTLILDSWHFPDELIAVVAEHENLSYDSGEKITYVDVIQVANIQSHLGTDHYLANIDLNDVPSCVKLGLAGDVDVVDIDGYEVVDEMNQILSA